MDIFEKIQEIVETIWSYAIVRFIVFLLLAFIVGIIAKILVSLLLKALKLDKKLDKWGINDGKAGTSIKFMGNLAFLIGFLIILPSAFEALNLVSVTTMFTSLAASFVEYIPNIIASILVLYVGILVAGLVEQIVRVFLKKTKIDNFSRKFNAETPVELSRIIAKILSVTIIITTVVQAILLLQIEAISGPAGTIVDTVFGSIPTLFLAILVLAVGIIIAKLIAVLLTNLLNAFNFDGIILKILPQAKKISATKILVGIVRTVIILFCLAQAVEILNFAVLTSIMIALIGYLPLVAKSFLIVVVAFFGAVIMEKVLLKAMPGSKALAGAFKAAIYVLAIFMVFAQLEIANAIIVPAFIITLAAAGIAFALAFGLGGQEYARKTLTKKSDCEEKNNENKEENK